jgi:hypothetical protein
MQQLLELNKKESMSSLPPPFYPLSLYSLLFPPSTHPSLPTLPFLPSSLPPFLPSSLPPFLPSSLPPYLPLLPSLDITLVMVTHDVGLKEFADRVIWMSDGKIKHVEHVDPKKQQQRIQKLQDDTEV